MLKVSDFGPLGAADDSGTFNAAITAAMAEPRGCRVEMPAGTFNIANQVVLPRTAGKCVKLVGEGKKTSMFQMAPSMTSAGMYVGAATSGPGCDLRCEGFGIKGSSTQKGMELHNANGFIGRELSFDGLYIGMQSDDSYWLDLGESEFANIALYGFVTTTGAHGLRIHRCGFYNMTDKSIMMAGAAQTFNLAILNCDFETVGSVFQTEPGVYAFSFSENYVEYAANAVFSFGGTSGGVVVRSNEFQSGTSTTIANIAGLDFSYNALWNQKFTMAASVTAKTVAGNKPRGTSSIS